MEILKNAGEKIRKFNRNPKDRPPKSYHDVLLARAGSKTFVDESGGVREEYLKMIDWALRSYFIMNRGNVMRSREEFVNKLRDKLASHENKKILATLRDVTIMSPSLEDYRSDVEELYASMSNPENGLSANGTHFCVGSTKIMHMLFPELCVMLDRNVAKAVLERSSSYNNFRSYWKVMKICRNELIEWQKIYDSTDSLLKLDSTPTTLTRIFDKCASIMVDKNYANI